MTLNISKPMMVLGIPGSSARYVGQIERLNAEYLFAVKGTRFNAGQDETVWYRNIDGKFNKDYTVREKDIVNVPEVKTLFLNVYSATSIISSTLRDCDTLLESRAKAATDCIGILELTVTDNKVMNVIIHPAKEPVA